MGNETGIVVDEGAVGAVAEAEDLAKGSVAWGLRAEEEEEEAVARVGLGELEIVAVEGGASVCYDEVEGC